ncbi:MAG: methionine adenosyltransferase [Christensenellales bacterium]
MKNYLFTSESVTEGHPDKLCDAVSDAVLDAYIAQDPQARVACECCAASGVMMIFGEITSTASVDVRKVAKEAIRRVGYTNPAFGFCSETSAILLALNEQSPDIAMGVDSALDSDKDENDTGAGDQGIMFGYAADETPALMPAAIYYAHKLTEQLAKVRKGGTLPYLRPDGKSQVSFLYENDAPVSIDTIVVSTQHSPEVSHGQIEKDVIEHVVLPVIPERYINENTRFLINPTGRFVVGGPQGDSGLTGRKIIVDTYGGYSRHGGGAFSGKDPTKVDRSASYMARYIAKNMVAAGLAKRCEVQLAYAIGVARPVSINVNSFKTGAASDEKLAQIIEKAFDLRPAAIINYLDLRRPIYQKTSNYGHFGREDQDFTWEKTDKAALLKELFAQ